MHILFWDSQVGNFKNLRMLPALLTVKPVAILTEKKDKDLANCLFKRLRKERKKKKGLPRTSWCSDTLKYEFCKKSLRKNAPLNSWTLFSSQKGTCTVLRVPFCEEKSVQLFRVAYFGSDFLQNPYFSSSSSFPFYAAAASSPILLDESNPNRGK